jgi:hypothetical protein
MTQVERPWLNDVRDCHLYRFWVRHPLTGERVLGYIGETARLPFERLMEHVMSQPWADTILAWEVDDRVYPGKQAVLEAEAAAIRSERPLYNYRENLDNPHRVEIWRAKEQRRVRDAARGRPRWVQAEDRESTAFAGTAQPDPFWLVRAVNWLSVRSSLQIKTVLWSVSWVTASLVLWGVLQRLAPGPGTWVQPLCATTVCLAALLWGLLYRPKRRRRRRR